MQAKASVPYLKCGFIGTLYVSGVLEEGVNELDNEATKKAKFFYQSCMDLRKYTKLA